MVSAMLVNFECVRVCMVRVCVCGVCVCVCVCVCAAGYSGGLGERLQALRQEQGGDSAR